MGETSNEKNGLSVLGAVLIRCFLLGTGFLLIWFLLFALAADWIYAIHSWWFDIPRPTFDAVHYAGMAAVKCVLFVFFLIPWISIRMVGGKREKPE